VVFIILLQEKALKIKVKYNLMFYLRMNDILKKFCYCCCCYCNQTTEEEMGDTPQIETTIDNNNPIVKIYSKFEIL